MRRTLALAGAAVLGFTGLAGPAAADPGAGIATHGVLISEFSVGLVDAGSSNNIDGDFIEFVNHGTVDVEISSWMLSACDATNLIEVVATIPADITLNPGEHYLLADDNYAGGDIRNLEFSGVTLVQSDGGLRLDNAGGTPQDVVKWGSPDDPQCAVFDPAGVLPTDDESVEQDLVNGGWELDDEPTPTRGTV